MEIRTGIWFLFILYGCLSSTTFAQDLVTECWDSNWTKYLEKCYLVVSFKHSWAKANDYCSKYGAKLAEPAGITVNGEVASWFQEDYWIGYNLIDISPSESYKGRWSDGRLTSVIAGVWGQNQPNPAKGKCTYVEASDTGKLWYTADCERVMPFVCEMNPCPQGMFQCSGRCIDSSHVCDGSNDCGDNRDEADCSSSCTYHYTGTQGTIDQETTQNRYEPNKTCQWTIETTPGHRINVKFQYIETEANTDFLEVWDGGLTLESSTLLSRLSGRPTGDQLSFISSYNFVILRFVSDATVQERGFRLTWKTEYECAESYKTIQSSTFSNTEIQEGSVLAVGSKQGVGFCQRRCDSSSTCYGFVYKEPTQSNSRASCRLFKGLPILVSDSLATMYMKMCPPGTQLDAMVSLPATSVTATSELQQLSTPLYPLPYIGNMELEYTITTEGNNVVTLEIADIELCCEDTVAIYDGTPDSHTLLETLDSASKPHLVVSTSPYVFIKMTLNNHWKCRGVLITYKQGCDNVLSETGDLSSPGYGTPIGYPGYMQCSWTLYAPSQDRSITIVFEDFDLEPDMDFLTIETPDGLSAYTGSQLLSEPPITAKNYSILTLTTSAIGSRHGFKASFSPGCSSLKSDSVVLSSNYYNYLDEVTLRCAEGYYFADEFNGNTEVSLKCVTGGIWDKSPKCVRAYCGPPPLIDNGYIVSAGVQGGENATYECVSGFSADTPMVIKCNANGSWDAEPNCISGECPTITSQVTDVLSTLVHGDGLQYGSVYQLSCSQYREIHGAATVQCMNGTWDFVGDVGTICHSEPCQTPVIPYLSPDPLQSPYVVNQAITVSCKSGYRLVGPSVINCNVTGNLPTCEKMKCSLNFDYIVAVENPERVVYDYGESVEVECNSSRYKLTEFHTSSINLTCLSNGQWNKQPSCIRLGCGEPPSVKGAVYSPLVPCLDHGCSFTFTCKNKYELEGESSIGNNIVTCGEVHDGMWDFGVLRCIGGQCPDPGYPPSGYLMTNGVVASFQEGSSVTFGCTKPGYGLHPVDWITCIYNETAGVMEWDNPVPTCVDIQAPVINNCPSSPRLVTNMQTAGFAEPFAVDLNLKTFTVTPQYFHPDQPVFTATALTYRASDFAGNTATCRVSILISGFISCQNKKSLNYLVSTEETIDSTVIAKNYVINKDPQNVFLYYSPSQPNIQVSQSSDMLGRIDTVEVRATDKDQNVIDTCQLQFRYRGYKCSKWGIHIPGGGVNCQAQNPGSSCHAYCNTNKTFMELPGTSSIPLECTEDEDEGIWNRLPPVCASISSSNVAYTAIFDLKYSIHDGVTDYTSCIGVYRQQIENMYPTLAADLENLCTTNQNNQVTINIKDMTQASFSYNDATNMMDVRIKVTIHLQNEDIDNVLAVKDACTSHIQTAFNLNTSTIASVRQLAGSTGSVASCGAAAYKSYEGTPMNEYACEGERTYYVYKDKNNKDVPSCLTCPLGYFKEGNNCSPCPIGTYGYMTDVGSACQSCPFSAGPGMTGLTDISQCEIKGICQPGYYSSDGLTPCTPCPRNFYSFEAASQTCAPCPSDKITNGVGKSSESECKTLEEMNANNETSVCNPSPCGDRGVCSIRRRDYYCTCDDGYTGRDCLETLNACSSNPCENDHQCIPGPDNTYSCICSAEFTGSRCEFDISTECDTTNRCENNGTCHNRKGGFTCVCPAAGGYTNADGSCNTQIDPCVAYPCVEGTCVPHNSNYRTCSCYPGFTGEACDIDIDDCDPNPCVNGAVCVDGVDSFSCTCGEEYYGDFCQFGKACNRSCETFGSVCNSCRLNNTDMCENYGNSYICHCKNGFTGTDCEIEDTACSSYPCKHGGTCHVRPESLPGYRCQCSEPWTGMNCESEISNCPEGDSCFNGGICYSSPTGYQCDCIGDFIGPTCNVSYDLCTQVDACAGNGVCSYSDEKGFGCQCDQGFGGASCQTPDPVCTSDYCLNGGICSAENHALVCDCTDTGFQGDRCEVDVPDCDPNPCGANQQCIDMVNGYVCRCENGKRGENCDKDVGVDFDYIIGAPDDCRQNENVAVFGDGSTTISQLTVAFWFRYTQFVGEGIILNIYGSVAGASVLPRVPDFGWIFTATGVTVGVNDNRKRRKREEMVPYEPPCGRTNYVVFEQSVPYLVEVADGIWHHLVMTWSSDLEELTVYVDGQYKGQLVGTFPFSKSGFIVFGAYDTNSQTGDARNSFKGRISRLFITSEILSDAKIEQLADDVSSGPEAPLLLHQEANLMVQYMVDYYSELTHSVCTSGDTECGGFYDVSSLPGVSACDDVLVITDRSTAADWPSPTFTNTNPATRETTRVSGGSNLEWGVYGISVAEYDQKNNSAVCSFRLYNYPNGCTSSDRKDISCTSSDGAEICEDNCDNDQQLTGSNSAFQTCSKYSMWGQDLMTQSYNYPQCAATVQMKVNTILKLTVTITNTNCEDIRDAYREHYLAGLNTVNYEYYEVLCGTSVCDVPQMTCDASIPDKGTVVIPFGLLPAVLSTRGGRQLTPEETLKVAVADEGVFTFDVTVNGEVQTVTPIRDTVIIDTMEACEPGYQISGVVCVLCGSGTYYNADTSTCERCPIGSYRNILEDGTTLTSPCTPCPGSSTTASDGAPARTNCVSSCLAGRYYSEVSESCVDCAVGFYQPQSGQLSCIPCSRDKTTDGVAKTDVNDCVFPETITTAAPVSTTEPPAGPAVGAATESGLATGVIVAVVLGVIILVLIIVLLVCILCFKCQVPCLAKKTQEVAPEIKEKDRYFANKYGEREMKFVNYNLPHIREKKGRPLDKEPFMEPPLSDESGSVKNDISIHVPVFMEKLDGSVSKKHMFISNNLNVKSPTPRAPMTSSPREPMTSSPRANIYHDIDFNDERKHKKKRKKKTRPPTDFDGTVGGTVPIQNGQVPKALAPLPKKLKSVPPDSVHLRPSSALERPRENITPSHYENFLPRGSLERGLRPTSSSERDLLATTSSDRDIPLPRTSSERETIQAPSTGRGSRDRFSPDQDVNDYEDNKFTMKRIEVESDTEDLR